MKKFDKFILWLFSLILLAIVVFSTLLVFDLFNTRNILENTPKIVYKAISEDRDIAILILVVLVIFLIFAIKGFLFQSRTKKDKIDGILLENNNGKLLISRDTLENLVRDISKQIQGTESISSKIHLDENNEIVVNINAIVYQDAVIKDVTIRMQEDIKTAIKQASDLEVSEINVNIEKISNKTSPEKKLEEKELEEEKEKQKEKERLELEKEKLELEKEKLQVKAEVKKVKETSKTKEAVKSDESKTKEPKDNKEKKGKK